MDTIRKLTSKDIKRFWSKVDSSGGADSCWNWTAGRNRQGYGKIKIRGKTLRSNRVAYELGNGVIPANLHILHSCDNPACCNPKHLFAGTQLDNMRDMAAKNRSTKGIGRNGESNGRHKLTAEQVRTIRTLYAAGGVTKTELAHEVGVSRVTVSLIVRRKIWKGG